MKYPRVITLSVLCIAAFQLLRPISSPALVEGPYQTNVPGQLHFSLPATGETAVAVDRVGTMVQSGSETAVPIASVAKIMTAYIVLKQHPLTKGEDGPTLTVTPDDVETYNQDEALGQSLAPVTAGEKLTERQLLEALLLPSANNIATLLAKWVDGTEEKFVNRMNQTARNLRMSNTQYADASGFNPKTVSTATDQIKIAEAAMHDPTFESIVAMQQAPFPISGVIYNVDHDLGGPEGIIGVKTGSTDEAGGCFVFAARPSVQGHSYLLVGAVLGQQGETPLKHALDDAKTLVSEAKQQVQLVPVAHEGESIATVTTPWHNTDSVEVSQGAAVIAWPGMTIHRTIELPPLSDRLDTGFNGRMLLTAGQQSVEVPVTMAQPLASPSLMWRLTRS